MPSRESKEFWNLVQAEEAIAHDPTAHVLDRIHALTELYFLHRDNFSEQATAITLIQCLCIEEQEKGW